MKALWQQYSVKFLTITPREQYLILLTGLVVIVFGLFSFVIEGNVAQIQNTEQQLRQMRSEQHSMNTTIGILEQSLQQNPNVATERQIKQYENKLAEVDKELLLLTTDLINPIQMRYALMELLKTERNVALAAFEVMDAQEVSFSSGSQQSKVDNTNGNEVEDGEQSLTLYKHSIRVTLSGDYFSLRDYLKQLEQLDWTFFWQTFDYQLTEYPKGKLVIEMYSLSTKKEFVGV
ncbi:MSHA biogenesis protein MshJ [Thalassotalea insulae]|uniref:MSHA biogenesis protein MshJ n=1 Tax=Thalassotalea insulae TaxID=2056778 RepID=A0ABQ6GRR5_9GAMM|nr:hypothetical protein [Thalassotalea insulae]GLX77874.1 MSHA biogenesis protein MshJ [Thalassotalea insulae]